MLKGVGSKYWTVVKPIWDWISLDEEYEIYKIKLAEFPKIQSNLFVSQLLVSEVQEGGFFQFYFNTSGMVIYDAVEGLRALGMNETADVVQKSIDYYENKDLTNRDIRVGHFNRRINELNESFKHLSSTECGGFEVAATHYLMENISELDDHVVNLMSEDSLEGTHITKKVDIDWDELDRKYSVKEESDFGYSLSITKAGLANIMECLIGQEVIRSAIDEYDKGSHSNQMPNAFITHLGSDYCVEYAYEKFQSAEDPFVKSSLASLLGRIGNKTILNYYDLLTANDYYKHQFSYVLENLISQDIVKPMEIKCQIVALEAYNSKAYQSLMDTINKRGYSLELNTESTR